MFELLIYSVCLRSGSVTWFEGQKSEYDYWTIAGVESPRNLVF